MMSPEWKWMLAMEAHQPDLVRFMVSERGFTQGDAEQCVASFLETMRYVLERTGSLPPFHGGFP